MPTPVVGEVLPVKREVTNDCDLLAVAVLKDGKVMAGVAKRAVTSSPIDSSDLGLSGLDLRCQHHTRGTVNVSCEFLARLQEKKQMPMRWLRVPV